MPELPLQWRRLVALSGERWAAGTQSVFTVPVCLLISVLGFFFLTSGLKSFSVGPNRFQYNCSSIYCTPRSFHQPYLHSFLLPCLSFNFSSSFSSPPPLPFSFVLFAHLPAASTSFLPLMLSVALYSSHCIVLISGIAGSPLACGIAWSLCTSALFQQVSAEQEALSWCVPSLNLQVDREEAWNN